jgi:hypothetical protein
MRTLAIIAALAALSACSEPTGEDTADLAPEAASADVSGVEAAGDGAAPELANVQAAIDRECPTLRARVASAMCEAQELGATFTCTYAFAQDPEGTERSVTLAQDGEAWMLSDEPEFCTAMDRANLQADMDTETAETE